MLNQLSTTISLFFLMLTGVLILAGCGASNPDKTVAAANERAVKVVSSSIAASPKATVLAVNDDAPVKVMKAGLKTSSSNVHGSCSVDSCALPPALQKRMMMLKQQQEQAKATL